MILGAVTEVVVASRDVDRHVEFLQRAFGFSVVDRGDDGSVVVGVPGVEVGRVRLVAAQTDAEAGRPEPGPPLSWEIGPRLLAVRSRDLARSHELFVAAGGEATEIVTYRSSDFTGTLSTTGNNSEFVGRGPDHVLWAVACELGNPSPAFDADPARLNTELYSLVIVVQDVDSWRPLFSDLGGLTIRYDFVMDGDAIERVLTLPPGTQQRFLMYSDADDNPMRIEIMDYPDLPGGEQRHRAVGIKSMTIVVNDTSAMPRLLAAPGVDRRDGRILGPGGIEMEFLSRPV
jgi:hypothetical protein